MKFTILIIVVAIISVVIIIARSPQNEEPHRVQPPENIDFQYAQSLMRKAQEEFQRLSLGPVNQSLFQLYRTKYDLDAQSLEDYCARLIASSLSRTGKSQKALEKEFQRVSSMMDGLLITYGEIGQQHGLGGSFSAQTIDTTIKDPGERELFKTAFLADSIITNWAFVVGYQFHKAYNMQPTLLENSRGTSLSQQEVDVVFENINKAITKSELKTR